MQLEKKKVLIIGKNLEISSIVEILKGDFEILTLEYKKGILEKIVEKRVELIILDSLIDKDFKISTLIKTNYEISKIPLILITSSKNLDFQIKALKVGITDFINTPIFNPLLYVSRIKTYISLYECNTKTNKLVEKKTQDILLRDKMLQARSKFLIMGEMFEMITHQWKQPLTTLNIISGSIKLSIKHNRLKYDTLVKKLNDLEQQIVYMSETINDFKSFFNNKKEKTILDFKVVVQRAIKLSSHFFNKNSLQLDLDLNSVYINADKNELVQVLLNIFNNSRDAFIENSTPNKIIALTLKQEGGFAVLNIRDNAGGINEEIIEKVFDPHFSTKNDKGNGIGLYMSKVIINNHLNGNITVKNVNNGVEFCIKLPISQKI